MQNFKAKEMILLYNIKNKPFTPKLKSILLRLGIRIKVVDPSHYNQPISSLLSGSTPQSSAASDLINDTTLFDDEMMVMAGLTNARLDVFLAALRKEGIRIPLKAILTPHNSNWTSIQLHDELVLEHEKMQELNNQ